MKFFKLSYYCPSTGNPVETRCVFAASADAAIQDNGCRDYEIRAAEVEIMKREKNT